MNQWQPMDFRKWPTAKRLRAVLTAVLVLLVGGLLYRTFAESAAAWPC
jgi:hypothetical protein